MFQAKVEANRLIDGRIDLTIPALTKCTSKFVWKVCLDPLPTVEPKDVECEL